MSKQKNRIGLQIDNRNVQADPGTTILDLALEQGIYIPTLCAHKDLSPYGGCRMCIVEIEGVRGLPTACTTPVEEGMAIRTRTAKVQEERTDVLRLILSEHTSSCLICDEEEQCRTYMGTIRKVGVTTGCRSCPTDGDCELQEVVDYLGVKDLHYPIYYRNLRVEKEDPFYDRDYNLCILCGRCIRVCQEIRTADTLTFKQRGPHTVIGPAYERNHVEAGCEFCGACVEVCPTGTLSEKARKWSGSPDREETSTCSMCGVGCQVRLLVSHDEIIGSLPAEDPLVNKGQLCVKGRFCLGELVNHHTRARVPAQFEIDTHVDVSWDKAIDRAAERIAACPPRDYAMLVSPNLLSEDLYLAQKFVRAAAGSANIDCGAREYYGQAFNAYLDLFGKSVPLADLQQRKAILCVGLDVRYGRSVVGVELRRALKNGAKIVSVHPRRHNLSLVADACFEPEPGQEAALLEELARLAGAPSSGGGKASGRTAKTSRAGTDSEDRRRLERVARLLSRTAKPVILVGSEYLQRDTGRRILEAVLRLAECTGADLMPLPAQNNFAGSVLMGAYHELLPGARSFAERRNRVETGALWETGLDLPAARDIAAALEGGKNLGLLHLVGETPLRERPAADYLIYQNIYPAPDAYHADLNLPAAAVTESSGTFVNGEGRVQRVRRAVPPAGNALPDWDILCRIARRLGKSGFEFSRPEEIQEEIASLVEPFAAGLEERDPRPLTFSGRLKLRKRRAAGRAGGGRFPMLLTKTLPEHAHRGFTLSTWVAGARQLFREGTLSINPQDAREAAVAEGDQVVLKAARDERICRVRLQREQPRGTLHLALGQGEPVGPNPVPVRIRKHEV